MLPGESQFCSWAASGWVTRSLFVHLSYAFKALLNIILKLEAWLEDDVAAV